ncbi:hypothetical protein B0J13DRAFT_25429 [Dactylonectria estremocensis]|uniref:Mid2 domain-containing protein n=1 Tax=Dactylonectria estremocensis TaxID=1079267 RepID=A0A9P9JDZ4_9HYPO|nr:hypothetical protein B0J13DRAFT_25429 [Dactylonectria estremocensis]
MDRLAYNVKKAGLGDMVQNNAEETIKGPGAEIPSSTASAGPGPTVSVPDYVQFVGLTDNTYVTSQNTLTLKYDVTEGVLLNYLLWQSLGNDDEFDIIANATFKESKGDDGQDATHPDPFESVTDSTAVVDLKLFGKQNNLTNPSPMRFLMSWKNNDGKFWGTSTSKFFAIVDGSSDSNAASEVVAADASSTATEIVSSATATASKDGGKSVTTQTSAPSSESSSASSSEPNSGKSKGGGGLGTGAIAGIAVGAIIGVLLIGALAWFFLRKRRQNKKLADGYTATDSGNAYIVDKETHGRTADSPNSPYSDENGVQHVPADDTTRDDPATTERGLPRTSTSGSQGGRSVSGAQTPQGVSTNVAHLVEDGMTADEIRRLEEEERQLDDEIERAARR